MSLWGFLSSGIYEPYLLTFLRITSALVMLPIFGYQAVPLMVKVALGAILTLSLSPAIPSSIPFPVPGVLGIATYAVVEVLIGLAIGAISTLLLASAEMAGRFLGIQSGIGIATTIDPLTQQESDPLSQLKYWLALVLFLTLEGHHWVLQALQSSLELIPIGGAKLPEQLLPFYSRLVTATVSTAIQLVTPVLGVLLITDVALGFIARAVPQMNIFILSIPLKVGVSLAVMIMVLPLTAQILTHHFRFLTTQMVKFIAMIGGR